MRISDWSSDVCSSDLLGDAADIAALADRRLALADAVAATDVDQHGAHEPAAAIGDDTAGDESLAEIHAGRDQAAQRGIVQIRSAPGRATRCQSVQISGGAVS